MAGTQASRFGVLTKRRDHEPESNGRQQAGCRVIEYAQSQLLQGCVTLARPRDDLKSETDIVGSLVKLIEPHLESQSASGSGKPLDKLRALAVEAALNLCAVDQQRLTGSYLKSSRC
jgi:hypothetical protein